MAEGNWDEGFEDTNGPSPSLDSGLPSSGLNGDNGRGRGSFFSRVDDKRPGDNGTQYQSGSSESYQGGRGYRGNSETRGGGRGGGDYRGNSETRGRGGGGRNNFQNTESSGWDGGKSNGGWESGRGGNFGGDEDDVPSGGSGGGTWGSRGGGYNRGSNENGGGYRGGQGGGRGYRQQNSENGSGGYNNDENGGGYRTSRGQGGGFRREDNEDGGGGGYRGGSRGRGGGSRRDDNEDGGGGGGGYRGGSRGRGGGFRRDDNEDGGSGGGYRGGGRGGHGGYGREDIENGGEYNGENRGGGGGFSGRGGGGGRYRDGGRDERGEGDENKGTEDERPPPYFPPEKTDDDNDQTYIPSGMNFSKYADIPVNVSGSDVPPSINSFEESGLRNILLENVKKANYTVPTPIQKASIPAIMAGRDLMSCAQTGSGKTAAFLLPMLHKMLTMSIPAQAGDVQNVLGLIIAPTRELADQIETEALKFARNSTIRIAVAYGGTSTGHTLNKIEKGIHLLVATPGRLGDIVNRGKLNFENLQFLVLDEADRMLQMGFREEIEKLLAHNSMPEKSLRQTLMFSATFPREIQEMAARMLNNYVFIAIGNVGSANEDIDQQIYEVTRCEKRRILEDIINIKEKTMIFVSRKKLTDFIASILSQKDIPSTSLHGDRHQYQRELALHDFRTGKMKTIVCTDVAARGLDIKGVDHVINFDMPSNIDDYVHRIGRTGRVGNPGKASSFFEPDRDYGLAKDLVRVLSEAHKEVPDFLQSHAEGSHHEVSGGGGRFGSRDIRNTREFESRSTTDHYEGSAGAAAVGIDEGENWD